MGVTHTHHTSGMGFKTAEHVSLIDLDNRLRWDYPNYPCDQQPHMANECLL